jgi:DNA-binding winged helix-turn-helix (wHTH) protein
MSQSKGTRNSKKGRTQSRAASHAQASKSEGAVRNWLQLAQLRYEKCELTQARVAFEMAVKRATRDGDLRLVMEGIAGLLRLAADACDDDEVRHWDMELDHLMASHAGEIPPMAWYCKGVIARRAGDLRTAQRFVHRYIRLVRLERDETSPRLARGVRRGGVSHVKGLTPATPAPGKTSEAEAKGWVLLATILRARGRTRRSRWLAEQILSWPEGIELRSIRGLTEMVLGNLSEDARDLDDALVWYQRAHASFLGEHNWYYHLYVLYGYARIYRKQQNYPQANWYLDLLDKATTGSDFGLLRKEIASERSRLNQDAVDLTIDSRQGMIRTRESGRITLRKQYVLLHILEALSGAHGKQGGDAERGLSKAEIIQAVWNEAYRPEAHDNKLYYNINRLRKLIEPDVRKPQYLLNWKEGYRLAPGLKVHFVGGRAARE